jgi:L-ascorbate metabolism protein UlaG (beta-lactamase superfamily)
VNNRKFSLTCFGVGDGWPCADRNHAAFLYRFGRTALLVDCGESVDGSLKATGMSYDGIDAVLLSHLHPDHVGGFFMLMQGFWLEGRRRDLPVYLPGGAIKPLREMLKSVFIFDELLNFRLRFKPMKSPGTISINDVRVTAFPTTHLEGLRRKFQKKYRTDFSANCFLFQAGGRRIGHSADLGRPEDLDPLVRQPLDLLVCEMAHFAPEEIFLYLRGRRIKRVVFMHLGRTYWEDLSKTRRLAAKMLPDIPHTFAHDGSVIGI